MPYCPQCGRPGATEEDRFCAVCGVPFSAPPGQSLEAINQVVDALSLFSGAVAAQVASGVEVEWESVPFPPALEQRPVAYKTAVVRLATLMSPEQIVATSRSFQAIPPPQEGVAATEHAWIRTNLVMGAADYAMYVFDAPQDGPALLEMLKAARALIPPSERGQSVAYQRLATAGGIIMEGTSSGQNLVEQIGHEEGVSMDNSMDQEEGEVKELPQFLTRFVVIVSQVIAVAFAAHGQGGIGAFAAYLFWWPIWFVLLAIERLLGRLGVPMPRSAGGAFLRLMIQAIIAGVLAGGVAGGK